MPVTEVTNTKNGAHAQAQGITIEMLQGLMSAQAASITSEVSRIVDARIASQATKVKAAKDSDVLTSKFTDQEIGGMLGVYRDGARTDSEVYVMLGAHAQQYHTWAASFDSITTARAGHVDAVKAKLAIAQGELDTVTEEQTAHTERKAAMLDIEDISEMQAAIAAWKLEAARISEVFAVRLEAVVKLRQALGIDESPKGDTEKVVKAWHDKSAQGCEAYCRRQVKLALSAQASIAMEAFSSVAAEVADYEAGEAAAAAAAAEVVAFRTEIQKPA